jgi:hypothetical protein
MPEMRDRSIKFGLGAECVLGLGLNVTGGVQNAGARAHRGFGSARRSSWTAATWGKQRTLIYTPDRLD